MSEQSTMEALARLVPQGSRVLDLGCGNGAMLSYLQRERGCTQASTLASSISTP